jgi:hypothetical protein
MICSSVNLDRFIRPSLPSGRTLRIFGGASGGQVKMLKRALGLGAPQLIRGDPDLAEAVGFDTNVAHVSPPQSDVIDVGP